MYGDKITKLKDNSKLENLMNTPSFEGASVAWIPSPVNLTSGIALLGQEFKDDIIAINDQFVYMLELYT